MGLADIHERHGAVYEQLGNRRVVAHYGRPASAHRAVRNGAGLVEHAVDVVVVTGEDRIDFVDDTVSNRVPERDGAGSYALLLDPDGRIRLDCYVFNAGERLLLLVPPGEGADLAADWSGKTFIQDVTVEAATEEFAVFGVHGPKATEKVASVFSEGTPEEPLTFVRGPMGDAGATVVREDGLAGEEGYLVVSTAADAAEVFDTLETRGMNAAPFGQATWRTLTLEAGTPLSADVAGEIPNVLGLRAGVDFEKGCFVGQEVVSKVENRGRPSRRLVGLTLDAVPDAGATVFAGDGTAGEILRAAATPSVDRPIALALVGFDDEPTGVRVDGEEVGAAMVDLPFVEGSDRSARLPTY
jgi:aminomethyltransferase